MFAGKEIALSRLGHKHASGHLPDNQLDVLIVNRHTLIAVHALYLVHEILLGLPDPSDLEKLFGIAGTVYERVAGTDLLPVGYRQTSQRRHRVGVLFTIVAYDFDDTAAAIIVADTNHPGSPGQNSLTLGSASLEKFNHPR